MGIFGKKKVDPKTVELNRILTLSLDHSKVPEGVDEETYELIGRVVFHGNTFAEEMKKILGRVNKIDVMKSVKEAYPWINKENLNKVGMRAVDRLK